MNHATILHYFKTFPFYVKTDVALRNNYERIKSEFNKEYDPVYYLSENELKNEVFSLKIKNKDLSSDLETCKSRLTELEKHKASFESIFKLIEERTRPGTEEHVLKKLNHFFNGVYTK